MWGVITVGIICLTALFAFLIFARGNKPELDDREARELLDKAARLFGRISTPRSVDDMDVLTPDSAQAVADWLRAHHNYVSKDAK